MNQPKLGKYIPCSWFLRWIVLLGVFLCNCFTENFTYKPTCLRRSSAEGIFQVLLTSEVKHMVTEDMAFSVVTLHLWNVLHRQVHSSLSMKYFQSSGRKLPPAQTFPKRIVAPQLFYCVFSHGLCLVVNAQITYLVVLWGFSYLQYLNWKG